MEARTLTASLEILILLTSVACLGGCTADDDEGGNANEPSSDSGSAPPAPKAPWTKLGYDLASTYDNTAETQIAVDNVATLEEAHVFDVGASTTGTTLLVDDRAYVMSGAGTYCFDLSTGDEVWKNTDLFGSSSPTYEDGTLYLHTLSAELYALDASDGSIQWGPTDTKEHENGTGYSSPIVAGDIVVVGAATGEVSQDPAGFRGFLFAADKSTGEMRWRTYTVQGEETGASIWSSVSVDRAAELIYATTGNNYQQPASDKSDAFLALSMGDGAIQWAQQRFDNDVFSRYTFEGPDFDFGANPVLLEVPEGDTTRHLVSAGQKSGDIHVLDRDRGGEEVCKRNLGPGNANGSAGVFVNGAFDGTHLLFAANSQTSDAEGSRPAEGDLPTSVLFAIDPLSCDIVWERQLPSVVMAPISVANGVGFVGWGSTLEAFDVANGAALFSYVTPATIASAPAIADGRVAIGTGLPWTFGTQGSTVHVLELPDRR